MMLPFRPHNLRWWYMAILIACTWLRVLQVAADAWPLAVSGGGADKQAQANQGPEAQNQLAASRSAAHPVQLPASAAGRDVQLFQLEQEACM